MSFICKFINYGVGRQQRYASAGNYVRIMTSQERHKGHNVYSFIQAISIAPFQFHYYSDALPTQKGYCFGVSPHII